MTPYFGTTEPLPPARTLRAGRLTMLYERGTLRYIRLGDREVIRMIYAAVRDRDWLTAPYALTNEVIEATENRFRVRYTALYTLDDIRYEADCELEGTADSGVTFTLRGRARSSFLRNRIGLCVHHPIVECRGRPVRVTRTNGTTYTAPFPDEISPHQPFLDVQAMTWALTDGIGVHLRLEGDVFETEDQRNWSDQSYKTYSTPLALPFPVAVQEGDTLDQRVTLRLTFPESGSGDELPGPEPAVRPIVARPFPRLGVGRHPAAQLSEAAIQQLKHLRLSHYRIEIRLDDPWQPAFRQAVREAEQLGTRLELVAFFSDNWLAELAVLQAELAPVASRLQSLLPLHRARPATPAELLRRLYPEFKAVFPGLAIGYGTDGFFAELNRNRPPADLPFDFVSYSLNPQVHGEDIRTIIESLQAQAETVAMARQLAGGRPVFVSPLTLKPRHFPPQPPDTFPRNADPRQSSGFAAAFTLLSLKYLSGADQLTLYETTGLRGLLADDGRAYPVGEALGQVADAGPDQVLFQEAEAPLAADELLVAGQGKILRIGVDWVSGKLSRTVVEADQKQIPEATPPGFS